MIRKLVFLLIMAVLIAIIIIVPYVLVRLFNSNTWYWSVVPLLAVTMFVWVKGFDYIPI